MLNSLVRKHLSEHSEQRRVDIQLLRALAVSLVLWFHAQLPGLAGGFLGVDIFLVISGYLITGLIARRIEDGRFSIPAFYLDRAKRLLPASYTVFLVTGILGLWLLTDAEFTRYLHTLLGALTFTANFTLWQGMSYFDASAKSNVLLHVWSLSLEEQFYFLVPFALALMPRRFWVPLATACFALSFILCLLLANQKPTAAFYLLPTRAWELLVGALVALREDQLKALLPAWAPHAAMASLVLLLMVPVFMPFRALGFVHPGLDALVVTIATAMVILVRPRIMNRWTPVTRAGFWLGNISYSLYLVHWPLFALSKNVYFDGTAPLYLRVFLLVLALVLAATLHISIERPLHLMRIDAIRWRTAGAFVGASLTIWLVAIGLPHLRSHPRDYAELMRPNYGLSQRCDYPGRFLNYPACRTGDAPVALLWGDSFAMHLARALPDSIGPFVQATMSRCAPALGIAQIDSESGTDRRWAEECIHFNDEVRDFLASDSGIKTVIISSTFDQILTSRHGGLVRRDDTLENREFGFGVGLLHYENTVRWLVSSGHRVVIIGPPPTIGINLAACTERREMGLLTLGAFADCFILREDAGAFRASAYRVIEHLRKIDHVSFVDISGIFCDSKLCRPKIDDIIMFRDAGHLSVKASEYLHDRKLLILN